MILVSSIIGFVIAIVFLFIGIACIKYIIIGIWWMIQFIVGTIVHFGWIIFLIVIAYYLFFC